MKIRLHVVLRQHNAPSWGCAPPALCASVPLGSSRWPRRFLIEFQPVVEPLDQVLGTGRQSMETAAHSVAVGAASAVDGDFVPHFQVGIDDAQVIELQVAVGQDQAQRQRTQTRWFLESHATQRDIQHLDGLARNPGATRVCRNDGALRDRELDRQADRDDHPVEFASLKAMQALGQRRQKRRQAVVGDLTQRPQGAFELHPVELAVHHDLPGREHLLVRARVRAHIQNEVAAVMDCQHHGHDRVCTVVPEAQAFAMLRQLKILLEDVERVMNPEGARFARQPAGISRCFHRVFRQGTCPHAMGRPGEPRLCRQRWQTCCTCPAGWPSGHRCAGWRPCIRVVPGSRLHR